MNRMSFLAGITLAALFLFASHANAQVPGIMGTVYDVTTSAPAQGVTVNLYEDNGDGVYGAGDTLVTNSATDSAGKYTFASLDATKKYYIERPQQTINGTLVASDISGLCDPSVPNLIIDDFSDMQMVVADPTATSATSSVNGFAGVLGGERDLYAALGTGLGEIELRVNQFGNEVLQYDNTAGAQGVGYVTWDGVDGAANPGAPALNLGGVDLTNGGMGTGLLMRLGVDATGAGETFMITVYDDSVGNSSSVTALLPVTDGTATAYRFLPFSSFVGGASLTSVDAIELMVGDGNAAIDGQFDWIGSVGMQTKDFLVPEPTTISLGMLGLVAGLGFLRRRK